MKQNLIEQFYLEGSEYFVSKNRKKCSHYQINGELCDRCYKKSLMTVMSNLKRKDQKTLFFIHHLYHYPSCYGNNGLAWLYKLEEHVRNHDLNQAFGTDENIKRYDKNDFLVCIENHIELYNSVKKMNFEEKCVFLMMTLTNLPVQQIYDVNGILGLSEEENLTIVHHLYQKGFITLSKNGIVSELPAEGKNFLENIKNQQSNHSINIQNLSIIFGDKNNVQQNL